MRLNSARLSGLSRELLVAAALWGSASAGWAQATPDKTPAPVANPDATIVGAPVRAKTPTESRAQAWNLLTDAVNDDKHADIRIQGLAALGTMGSNVRSVKAIVEALADKDVDVRTAAVLAAGQTKDPKVAPALRKMLDDTEPQVAFAAASTLWKMHDRTGEDVLAAVVDGDRKATPGLVHGTMHSMNREMHDPAALAKLGALQGASMLLGPFGFGITAYEYIMKNGGQSARVTAIEEIAQNHTEQVRKEMIGALTDKDPTVRAAAAKALRSYHDPETTKALATLFDDAKRPVQFSAAAAYLISTQAVATPPTASPERP